MQPPVRAVMLPLLLLAFAVLQLSLASQPPAAAGAPSARPGRGPAGARPLSAPANESHLLADCANITEALDRCCSLASYSHTIASNAYPVTVDQLRATCPKQHEGLNCLKQQARCLRPLTKRALLSFVDSRRKHVKKVCSNLASKDSRDFVDTFKCIQEHKRGQFAAGEQLAIKQIDAIMSAQVRDYKERFQRFCCAINNYRKQTVESLAPDCGQPHRLAALEASLDSVVGEAIEFVCPDTKPGACLELAELQLADKPPNKSLTRAGTELMIVLTAMDDENAALSSARPHQRA